ncbi:hypothetical protein M7963_20345 [Enterobacter roggenkampii]|uniref:hypothetical protein n=1 Tax=Enterobacter roggenkampii TaxID=1812935 RepID=UPI002237211F|nr:hypothetical protein [Enterobacter roggenkampii]MCW5003869.1 hypothetical protein [Enterobacter roggenkampii]
MIKMIEGLFVDVSTGEIVDPYDYGCLPPDYDVSNAVEIALTGLPLKETYTTTALIKSGRGRKPKAIDNPYCSVFQNLARKEVLTTTGEIKTVAVMPSVIDDLVAGALRLKEGADNTEIPQGQLLFILAHLPTLSVEIIQELLSAKRILWKKDVPGIRYCQYLLRKCESVIESLSYHIERGNIEKNSAFDFNQDAADYAKYGCIPNCVIAPAPFTEGDRMVIRRMALAGNTVAADAYIQKVADTQRRMIERVAIPSVKQIEKEMLSEFPYDPYLSEY